MGRSEPRPNAPLPFLALLLAACAAVLVAAHGIGAPFDCVAFDALVAWALEGNRLFL